MTKTYRYRDAKGHLYHGRDATPPEGMTLVPDGVSAILEDGQAIHTPGHMMDSTEPTKPRLPVIDKARMPFSMVDGVKRDLTKGVGAFDEAGVSKLLDAAGSTALNDTLGACPADTHDIQQNVARQIVEARSAISDGGFQSALANLRAASGQYLARAQQTTDAKNKEALTKAGNAVAGYASALSAAKGGAVEAGGGYAGHKRRMADAWRG